MKKYSHFISKISLLFTIPFSLMLTSCDGGGDGSSSTDDSTTTENPSETENPPNTTPPTPTPTDPVFTANDQESAMATLISNDSQQGRASMTWNPILAQVARERAEDLAARDYFSHTNPDGLGPNTLVQNAGYALPSFYDQSASGNNIESLAAGNATAVDTLTQWLNSPGHRRHVLAEISFYQEQIDYGIGFAQDPTSTYRFYWVFISARH